MKPIKTKELIKEVENQGYVKVRQSGSHIIYRNPQTGKTLPSITNTREQAPGTLRNILKILGRK